jgi:hypothetical protein
VIFTKSALMVTTTPISDPLIIVVNLSSPIRLIDISIIKFSMYGAESSKT